MADNIVGRTLFDQFRVDAFLDAGGMGSVYRVWDLKRNVPLAMKVLHADLAEDPTMFKRFKREARALSKLAHPNIIPFYGLFEEDNFIFMLERFIDGPTLKEILKKRNGIPFSEMDALIYLRAICSALGYAHEHGVVHCDVKAANIMIDQGGGIYLGDFGIARHSDSTSTTMASAGTPAYMAPEQILAESVYPTTDIYSLGVLLFEMLTGQRPFRGDEAGTEKSGDTINERVRYAHLNIEPPDPKTLNPALNEDLVRVILKALKKDSGQRYQSCQELFSDACHALKIQPNQIPDRIVISKNELITDDWPAQTEGKVASPIKVATKKNSLLFFIVGILAVAIPLLFILGKPKNAAVPPMQAPIFETKISSTPVQVIRQTITKAFQTATSRPVMATATATATTAADSKIQISAMDNMPMVYIPAGTFLMGSESNDALK